MHSWQKVLTKAPLLQADVRRCVQVSLLLCKQHSASVHRLLCYLTRTRQGTRMLKSVAPLEERCKAPHFWWDAHRRATFMPQVMPPSPGYNSWRSCFQKRLLSLTHGRWRALAQCHGQHMVSDHFLHQRQAIVQRFCLACKSVSPFTLVRRRRLPLAPKKWKLQSTPQQRCHLQFDPVTLQPYRRQLRYRQHHRAQQRSEWVKLPSHQKPNHQPLHLSPTLRKWMWSRCQGLSLSRQVPRLQQANL